MITIENLTKYYGTNRAVNGISFTINDNEILGFLGPNGAGKSTTMNMISGYLPMSDGTVTLSLPRRISAIFRRSRPFTPI